MKPIIILIALVLSGCASTHMKIGVAHNLQRDLGGFDGDNPLAIFELEKRLSPLVSVSYWHLSHWSSGKPFNDRDEDTIDAVGVNLVLPLGGTKQYLDYLEDRHRGKYCDYHEGDHATNH